VPEGWKEIPGSGSMRVAAFGVEEGAQRAEATVVSLSGDAGGVTANVNRWRGQVGLPPTAEADIAKELTTITVSGIEGRMADLTGAQERILAVLVSRSGQTWFFKMQGPRDLIEKSREKFEGFVRSVRFGE
jgi:hypothetical protein